MLKAQDYNYGYNIGKRYKLFFEIFYRSFLNKLDKKILFSSQKHISFLKKEYPQKLERLKGIYSATGITLDKLHCISLYLGRIIKAGCTDAFVAPYATRDGKIYLAWNMDIFSASRIFMYFLSLIVIDMPSSKKFVGFGMPVLGAIGLLNEDGLSFVGTAVGMEDGNDEGLLDMEINNLCMERCSNVEDVIKTYKENKLQSIRGVTASIFLNLNCIWGDTKGNGVAIEHSANYIHFERANEILAIANHHQFLDRKLTGSVSPDKMRAITGSYSRLSRMWKLLRQNYGKIDFDVMKNILSDHHIDIDGIKDFNVEEPIDDGTICCHYWNIKRYLKEGKVKKAVEAYFMGKTLLSYIIEPQELVISRCSGNPCSGVFQRYNFKHLLENSQFKDIKYKIYILSKINSTFYRIPAMEKIMDFLFKKFIKKFLILLVSTFEKIIQNVWRER